MSTKHATKQETVFSAIEPAKFSADFPTYDAANKSAGGSSDDAADMPTCRKTVVTAYKSAVPSAFGTTNGSTDIPAVKTTIWQTNRAAIAAAQCSAEQTTDGAPYEPAVHPAECTAH